MKKPSPMKLARLAAGLELSEVAAELGCSKQAVSLWELGRRTPNARTKQRLAAIYAVSERKIRAERVDAGNVRR